MIIGSLTHSNSSNCWISSTVAQSVSVTISVTHSVQPLISHRSWCSVTLLPLHGCDHNQQAKKQWEEAPGSAEPSTHFGSSTRTPYILSPIRLKLTGFTHGGRTVRLPTVPHLGRVRHPSLEGYSSRGHESNESENALRSDSQSSTTSSPCPFLSEA